MAADQQQFLQLVENLMSGDNVVRNQAETTYDSIPAETKVPYLLESIRNPAVNIEVRQMVALLMRRLFSSTFEDFYPRLTPETQNALKEQLLATVQQPESVQVLRKKICEAVAELARNLIDDNGVNQWPEILKFLFDCANSNEPNLRENALHIFTCVPGIFGNQQNFYLEIIKQMLYQCLQDELHLQVRFAAVKAITAFLLSHEKDFQIQRHFVDCLPGFIQAISDSLASQEDDALLKCLIDLAESCPRFLRHQIENIINLCMKLLSDTSLDDSWRHLALEVIVTLSETAPAMVRKYNKFIPVLIPQILSLMVQLDDDLNWSTSDEVTDDDSDSNAIAGESALDRIACGLGGKTVLPVIISNIPQMLSSSDWRYRHAALMAISAVGEGCHKQMESLLPQIMDGVLPFLQDDHPRVRYAACNAVGQLSNDFAPNFEKKFHEKVIPGLLMVMDDNDNPRVQAHAGAALVNFSEDCPKNLLTPYLDAIMLKLETILNNKFKELVEKGTKLVLEQVVTTIASVADTAEEKFMNYYDRFMPCLKYIVQNANVPELRLLRGKTIECISLIGLAVGRAKFMQDASEVMELLLKAQTNQQEMEEDDPQISYMIAAWARMCKILGKQFEQYLPLVMGPVMKTASLKPEVALLDTDDMKAVSDDDDWQFVSLGDQQNFGIRTAGLEDKATACRMLACYARELKGSFVEYCEQVVRLMVPMLKFYFHDGVRMAAAESLPYLLECAKIKGQAYVNDMWNYICPELLKAIDIEPENDVLSEHMTALAQCIETLGKDCLREHQLVELFRILDKSLKDHFVRAAERQEKRKDEDYDEVVEESLMDEDDEDVFILSKVSDVLHALFSTYKESIFSYFDQLLPHVVRLLGADRSWSDHQWGLCVFDDVLEHGGVMAVKYQQYFLPQMLEFLSDKSPEVRQAAAFGVGVMGQFAGEPFAHVCAEAMPSLLNMINKPESRSPENINATENAIAAVAKILKYNHSCVSVDEILSHWITWLPVWEDEAEAPHVYGYLCDLIESNNPVILGINNGNLPRILSIMAEAFVREAVDEEADITKRMVNIVRQIQSNSEVFSACLAQLSLEQQQALHSVLTTH